MNRFFTRGKREYDGEWVRGFYLELQGEKMGEKITRHCIFDSIGRTIDVNPATLGRCTGLTDKNGKLVFEGDICKRRGEIVSVKYEPCEFCLVYSGKNGLQRGLLTEAWKSDIEIIGNIHDNSELSEATK